MIDDIAAQAVVKWLRSRCIGVINGKRMYGRFPDGRRGDEEQPGSGSMILWGKQYCILTARHVVEGAEKNDMRFFFPAHDIEFNSRGDLLRSGRLEWDIGTQATVYDIIRCSWEDIALLTIDPKTAPNTEFYDFNSGWRDPAPTEPIYCLGFPRHDPITLHVERTENSEHHILGLVPMIWTSVVIPKPDSLIDPYSEESPYDPNRHFLVEWNVEDKTLGMKGFSGAATWTDPDAKLWSPKLLLTGMVTRYYSNIKVGRMVRASVLKEFLEEALGPA